MESLNVFRKMMFGQVINWLAPILAPVLVGLLILVAMAVYGVPHIMTYVAVPGGFLFLSPLVFGACLLLNNLYGVWTIRHNKKLRKPALQLLYLIVCAYCLIIFKGTEPSIAFFGPNAGEMWSS